MATMRFTARVNRNLGDSWSAISTPNTIAKWYPGVISAETSGNVRTVRGESDGQTGEVKDIIITNDDRLHRFQYRVEGVEGHLATVDAIAIADDDTLIIYSVEVASDDVAAAWSPLMEAGVNGLKSYLEQSPK